MNSIATRVRLCQPTAELQSAEVETAKKWIDVAVKLARKEPHGESTRGIGNGKIDVPSILLTPVAVDKDNLVTTVIADGYQKLEDVYRDVPKDRWPKKP